MKPPLHVLWIPSWYPQKENPLLGSFFQEQIQALNKIGVQTGIIYPEIRPLKEFNFPLLKQNYFQTSFQIEQSTPIYRRHGWNLYPGKFKWQINAWVRQALNLFENYISSFGRPHLIHAQSSLIAGMAALEIARKYCIPYCVTEHRDVFLKKKVLKEDYSTCWCTPYIKNALDHANKIIAVSMPLKEALFSYTSQASISIIPNSVDIDLFCPPLQKKQKENFSYLTVCNLEKRKNVDLLLKSFQKVYKNDPKSDLVIVGEGPERAYLERLAKELEISRGVSFRGALSRQEVSQSFQEADAFVLASQNESFGVVCIEALASGIPVIATKCGGPETIVTPDGGLLVEKDDEISLTNALIQIKNTIHHYPSEKLRSLAVSEYSQKAVAEKTLLLYQSLLTLSSPCAA